MQTAFTPEQLADPKIAEANTILRKCVHCGFCTATCPTYVLLGDELDSPRGRIYLIKGMLERGEAPTAETVKHIDRCLSCLACVTTCPSGVDYMHLIDEARAKVARKYKRPMVDALLRRLLAAVMTDPSRFHASVRLAALFRPMRHILAQVPFLKLLAAMLDLAPASLPAEEDVTGRHPAQGRCRMRVALLAGCVQPVLGPHINSTTVRLLNRLGAEVIVPAAQGCCGSLHHHAGNEDAALALARRNIDLWADADIDHVVINASGCGTVVKDYGHMFRFDRDRAKAEAVAAKSLDIVELVAKLGLADAKAPRPLRVAYHSACSMQHGQKIKRLPIELLASAGFEVVEPFESHLCCGSAGTYNMLQPDIATRLRERKVVNISALAPDIIATGNLGCMTQIGQGTAIPIVHTVELLDWAMGGPEPPAMRAG
jgi:glycolate oxidase iron-sulfur subunit